MTKRGKAENECYAGDLTGFIFNILSAINKSSGVVTCKRILAVNFTIEVR